MAVVPRSKPLALAWFAQRTSQWLANAGALGLSEAHATALHALTQTARADSAAAHAARIAAQNALVTEDASIAQMRELGGTVIQSIRAFAKNQPDPSAVFALASIPPDAARSPRPPRTPGALDAALTNDGSLRIAWKGSANGGSVAYAVFRSIVPAPRPDGSPSSPEPMEQIAIVGEKSFVDDTIPPGTVSATYAIRAHKGRHTSAQSRSLVVPFAPRPVLRAERAAAA